VNGIVTLIQGPRFSIFPRRSYLILLFDRSKCSRLIPVQRACWQLKNPQRGRGSQRKDLKITEGQVFEEKHDIKGDIIAGTIAPGRTLVGAVFSHAVRGLASVSPERSLRCRTKGQRVICRRNPEMLVRMDKHNSPCLPSQ